MLDGAISMAEPIRHLYFHIPFCPKLCPYCSFYVEVGSENKNQEFLDALLLEVDQAAERFEMKPRTIYFGGGTPSALRTQQLDYLFSGLHQRLDLAELEEWDLEANPATIRPDKSRRLRELGVTRLSLGVQSWDDNLLKTLGRIHSADEAEETFHILRDAGFTNLNIDLMFAVPGQTDAQWNATLEKSIALGSEHVSTYCLTYEEDTEYFRKLGAGEFSQDDERDARLFEHTIATLESAGLAHYEISNYARPGFESRHNLAYWLGANYLGFGPSAFSTVGLDRWQNIPDTAEYIRRIQSGAGGGEFRETLSARTRDGEILAFGLRTAIGVNQSAVSPWRNELKPFIEHGLVIEDGDRIRLTSRGKLLADSVAQVFVGS
jgi:oxygen-independent coproporphyrinogen III oxidase